MKEKRIEDLDNAINQLIYLSTLYRKASPAWILIQAAWGHIHSVHHLEKDTAFCEETLGVIKENENVEEKL